MRVTLVLVVCLDVCGCILGRRVQDGGRDVVSDPRLDDPARLVKDAMQEVSRSGNTVEHFVPFEIGEAAKRGIAESFAVPASILKKSSSRSGAMLFMSENQQYFAKTVKSTEYQTLWEWASTLKSGRSVYHDMLCGGTSDACRESLVLPFHLAFIVRNEEDGSSVYFVVMPAAFVEEKKILRTFASSLHSNFLGSMFDVKPFPNRSEIGKLVQLLKKFGWSLNDFEDFEKLRHRLNADADHLTEQNTVDYSVLVWSAQYSSAEKMDMSQLPTCTQKCTPLNGTQQTCVILCFSIIDYLVEFTLGRQVESKAKYVVGRGDKFLDYGSKLRDMMQCLGSLQSLGLEFLECRPYLQMACEEEPEQSGDVVCQELEEQVEELSQHGLKDLFDDVAGIASAFVHGYFRTGVFVGKVVTAPLWLPAYATVKVGQWYVNTVWSSIKYFYHALRAALSSSYKEELKAHVEAEAVEAQKEFLRGQVELKLRLENDKAKFQQWCQHRFWRSFHDSECVTKKGLRWNSAHGRWEATWQNHDDRKIYGFVVSVPSPEDFGSDGQLSHDFDDFDASLEKADACLDSRDAASCTSTGGVHVE